MIVFFSCTAGPPGDLNGQLSVNDKEDDSELDMDDVITEAPTSPQNLSPVTSPFPDDDDDDDDQHVVIAPNKRAHVKNNEKEQIQSVKIKRTTDASGYSIVPNDTDRRRSVHNRPKTPMHIKREPSPSRSEREHSRPKQHRKSRELIGLLYDVNDHSKQAGRISKRRSTMATHHESNTPYRHDRKRRLSSASRDTIKIERTGISLRTHNSSGSGGDIGNDTITATPKRMRVDRSPVKSGGAAVVAQTIQNGTPKRNDASKITTFTQVRSLVSNVVAAAAVDTTATPTVTISSPRTNKSSSIRQSKSRVISTTTTRITQFFSSTPLKLANTTPIPISTSTPAIASASASAPTSATDPLKCDKCSTILNTINELNFHKKSHEMKCCAKCKKPIDTDENPIGPHVISCFLLDSKLPNDLLTRFLKVKVDLDRLTPIKIKQIQKNLQSNELQHVNNAIDKSDVVSHRRESVIMPPDDANRQQSKERSRRESMSATETAQNSITDKSINGKNDHGTTLFFFRFILL